MHFIKDSSDTDDSEIEVEKTPSKKKRAPMEEALQKYSYKTVFLNACSKFTGEYTC